MHIQIKTVIQFGFSFQLAISYGQRTDVNILMTSNDNVLGRQVDHFH